MHERDKNVRIAAKYGTTLTYSGYKCRLEWTPRITGDKNCGTKSPATYNKLDYGSTNPAWNIRKWRKRVPKPPQLMQKARFIRKTS